MTLRGPLRFSRFPRDTYTAPPDLVVEILSLSTKSYDRTVKRSYLESGVGEVWVVDVDERLVEVLGRESEKPEQVSEVLLWRVSDHAFEIPLLAVFLAF